MRSLGFLYGMTKRGDTGLTPTRESDLIEMGTG